MTKHVGIFQLQLCKRIPEGKNFCAFSNGEVQRVEVCWIITVQIYSFELGTYVITWTFFSKQKHQHFRYGLNILFQVASETECIPILNDKLLYKTCWDANKKTTPPFPDSLSHHQVDMIQILGIPQLEGAVTQLVPAATLAALVTSASLGGFKGDDSGWLADFLV